MLNTPLFDALMNYSNNKYPYHMPGHKFGNNVDLDLMKLDATEATGLDNLYDADGIIAQAMELMAKFYKSKHCIFLTNGSTAGIIAAILTVCKPGDKLIVARNCHYSVWNAMILADVVPIYVSPEYVNNCVIGCIKAHEIEIALMEYPEVKGAIIVSPTYEGIISDVKSIKKLLGNKVLIVDEAHGSHFILSDIFPSSSITQGADLVIQSMHKTLPAITQSALIHICSDTIDYTDVIRSLKLVQTSSPSYIMMGMMDYIRGYIEDNLGLIQSTYVVSLLRLRKQLHELDNLVLLQNDDISKIVIGTIKITGYKLMEWLEQSYNLGVEAAFPSYVILITTMADTIDRFDFLADALTEIDVKLTKFTDIEEEHELPNATHTIGMSVREVYFKEHCEINIEDAANYVCAQNIMLYPPGVPLVCIGEVITARHIELILKYKDKLKGVRGQNILVVVV
ncbi:MAG: hypothetical protein ATN34_00415 [Epulopiscium sp. Nele67-Bin002]|nr:MAG: hypothetical protein BEN18_08095 [Epulopiscium sp. Nuni2H_MBin001]OON91401.1 MAG: hypothetical protein ATN33_01300 [Epulopiscium sp. Nele67-Bin001]OON91569.1 MAG: hypothetical protein ATN34_00415 [Epulopiscium sp. Nele67-Bin002]